MKHLAIALIVLLMASTAKAQHVVYSKMVPVGKKAYLANVTANETLVAVYATSSITGGLLAAWWGVPSVKTHGAKGILSFKMPPGGITWVVLTWTRPTLIMRTVDPLMPRIDLRVYSLKV